MMSDHLQALAKAGAAAACRSVLERAADEFVSYHHAAAGACYEDGSSEVIDEEWKCTPTLRHAEICLKEENPFFSKRGYEKARHPTTQQLIRPPSEFDGAGLYGRLSGIIHASFDITGSFAYVRDDLPQSDKRALVRLLLSYGYTVYIMMEGTGIRRPTEDEIHTPPSASAGSGKETSPLQLGKRKRGR
jgi:hypothetical protein